MGRGTVVLSVERKRDKKRKTTIDKTFSVSGGRS